MVKIVDTMCSHEPFYFVGTPTLPIERSLNKIPLEIKPEDTVIYTDTSLMNTHPCRKKIALLLESQELHRWYYNYISTHNNLFDVVLTFDKKLLDRGENFRFNALGTTWLHESYRNVWPKNKLCSMIISNKRTTSGHKLRHDVAEWVSVSVDLYGGPYRALPTTTTRAFDPDHTPCHISNQKYRALKDYRFSIVIENCKEDYYFTEKLIDCFLSGTIPIYYGCPSIGNFFNDQGILSFTTLEECFAIVHAISKRMYEEKLPFVKDNFERAKKYTQFNLEEKYI
jgi:hypothetical protein